jgi:hypothetical protein
MSWDKEGQKVRGMYLHQFPVEGLVTMSRIKFGGNVSHLVTLDNPIMVYGAEREMVTLEDSEVLAIL